MTIVTQLMSRNLRLYFRDPLNVFFSLLAALIVFLLYALFLANVFKGFAAASAPQADPEQISRFVDAWMLAGLLTVTTITTPLGALGIFIEDATTGRFRDFLVSPLRRSHLVLGYLGAAFVIGTLITMTLFVLSLVYLWLLRDITLSPLDILQAIGWILLSIAAFTAIWGVVVSFLTSTGAFSAVSMIVGTVSGFVTGVFIALGSLPGAVRETISALPFAQAAMMVRRVIASDALTDMAGDGQADVEALRLYFGLSLEVAGRSISAWVVGMVLVGVAVLFTAFATSRIRSRIS